MNSIEQEVPMGQEAPKSRIKLIAALAVITALLVLSAVLPVREYAKQFLDVLQAFGAWGLVLLAAAYVVACVLFLPGSPLTLGAGFLAAAIWPDNTFLALASGTVAVSVGSVCGATAAFIVGRTFMRDWVADKIRNNKKFSALDAAVGKNGFKMVFLVRLSPVFPFNLLNYALGVTKVSLRDFVLASWIGMFPATVVYVYLGMLPATVAASASGEGKSPSEWAVLVVGLLATVALLVMITKIARKALADAVGGNE